MMRLPIVMQGYSQPALSTNKQTVQLEFQKQQLSIVSGCGGKLSVQQNPDPFVVHPDAIQRRTTYLKRREESQRKRMIAKQARLQWWEVDLPPNVHIATRVDEFEKLLEAASGAENLVVVDVFAPWCQQCKDMNQEIHELALGKPWINFIKFSTAGKENKDYCVNELEVKNVPCYLLFQNGFFLEKLYLNRRSIKILKRAIRDNDPHYDSNSLLLESLDDALI
eukprot:TRINITY_DN4105_c0_g1_i1.p1 TRINITY_DN4105_c0_g1~~TRINITY_DN4105_c0_g1_i1.p1  ORF type:complete len:223 (+),score=14.13 TRINITY_DN4105_c0_g1_i1:58-726(+)